MRASYDPATGTATVSARVSNLARRAGTTVVQLYLGSPAQGEPPKQLKGYAKVELGPRSRRVVTFRVGAGDLAYFDAGAGWTVAPGRYDATVGLSSRRGRAASFTVPGSRGRRRAPRRPLSPGRLSRGRAGSRGRRRRASGPRGATARARGRA